MSDIVWKKIAYGTVFGRLIDITLEKNKNSSNNS